MRPQPARLIAQASLQSLGRALIVFPESGKRKSKIVVRERQTETERERVQCIFRGGLILLEMQKRMSEADMRRRHFPDWSPAALRNAVSAIFH